MADQNAQLEKVLDHLDKIHAKCDAINQGHEKLSARMDAIEGEREKERADKARADAEAKARADAEAKEKADGVAENLAKIERAQFTEAQRAAFADAQMRCDAAYQAWGRQAPPALAGESLRDYKIRLLRPLQQHSKRYGQSALELIGDEAAFQIVNDAIVNDAVEASCDPAQLGSSLREITTRLPSGHVETKFVGDPAVTWAPFMGHKVGFGRIVKHNKAN